MTLPRKTHAVILDMDGLMFDTEALYRDAVIAAAKDGGHDIPVPFYLSTIGLSLDATRTAFRELTRLQLCLKAGLVELLDFLDDAHLPRAIATSSRHEDVAHNLGLHGLLERFETVIARGDYARGKPHPEPFLKAAERLGVDPELCLALEDSYHGVRAATGAGMMTIMVPDLLPPTPEMEALCVCIASDLHEVCALMRSR